MKKIENARKSSNNDPALEDIEASIIKELLTEIDEKDDFDHAIQKSFIDQVSSDPSNQLEMQLSEMRYVVYGDYRLHQNDLDCIKPGNWLTDAVIGFYFEYLNKKMFACYQESFEILCPSLVHLIKHAKTANEITELISPLNLPSKNLVIIPVNNALGNNGGCHWSVSVVSSIDNVARHFDVSTRFNKKHATISTLKVAKYGLNLQLDQIKIAHDKMPNSMNDCGVWLLHYIGQVLYQYFTLGKTLGKFEPQSQANADEIRKHILEIVKTVAYEEVD